MLPSTIVVAVFAVAHAERLNTPSSFMLVGGVSARSEMCLTGLENVGASLSDCGAAVAELDGREIWSLSAGGALTSLASKKCLAVPSGAVAGARVALASCDGPDASAAWELQGNGQIKLGSSNMCLSQSGAAPGNADLAASSSVIASSTLDFAHGAALAVDGLDSSYWVSKLDEASPVTLTVEFDEPAPVLEVGLDFEFVPASFSLQTSSGAGKWTDVYATDTNVLKTTAVPLTGHFVHGVRLVMKKPHATEGVLGGHALYGVRSFKVMAPQMRAVLEPCAVAAKSGDARDKYFAVAVGSFDPAAGAQLRSELPGLEAADAALAAAVTELAEVVPDVHACKKKGVAFSKKSKSREGSSRRLFGAAELAEQKALFDEAKQMIVSARSFLHQ